MKRLVDRLLFCTRVMIVTWAMLALVVSGAGAAQRLYTDQFKPESPCAQADTDVLNSKPDPDESTGGMTAPEGGCPCTEQLAWLQAVPALPGGGDETKLAPGKTATSADVLAACEVLDQRAVCATPALVSSQVAYRFTLVGSRPSGTS
jgi:hypothetical protein